MTQSVATTEKPALRSVVVDMATRFGMEPAAFEATLRATVVPKDCTREQFAAFLLVAREYGLNPLLKEIYAFPSRGGGIQPVVGVDGWMNLINSHPNMDGMEFSDVIEEGQLVAVTARIWRKDRSHSVSVTEYMSECKRPTDTWKQWPHRMLRHKAAIQCARYAFGFAGIVDPDEAERIMDATVRQISERPRTLRARLDKLAAAPMIEPQPADEPEPKSNGHDETTGEVVEEATEVEGTPALVNTLYQPQPPSALPALTVDDKMKLREYHRAIGSAMSASGLTKISGSHWGDEKPQPKTALHAAATAIYNEHVRRIKDEQSPADVDNAVKMWTT